jgi:hypothetical protein
MFILGLLMALSAPFAQAAELAPGLAPEAGARLSAWEGDRRVSRRQWVSDFSQYGNSYHLVWTRGTGGVWRGVQYQNGQLQIDEAWQQVDTTDEYIELYTAGRGIYVRLYAGFYTQFNGSSWFTVQSGNWVNPI